MLCNWSNREYYGIHSMDVYVRESITFLIGTLKMSFLSIQHPFLLSDNRHYTFYIWRRIFLLHSAIPYMFIPAYIACAWVWFLRVGEWSWSLPGWRERLTVR